MAATLYGRSLVVLGRCGTVAGPAVAESAHEDPHAAPQAAGAAGGYDEHSSVSLSLTPREARDLCVALGDLASSEEDGWHAQVEAWDGAGEVIVARDPAGARRERTDEELVDAALTELAAEGASVMAALRVVTESRGLDIPAAKQRLRDHPAWRDARGT